jgi:hypothetical protein
MRKDEIKDVKNIVPEMKETVTERSDETEILKKRSA